MSTTAQTEQPSFAAKALAEFPAAERDLFAAILHQDRNDMWEVTHNVLSQIDVRRLSNLGKKMVEAIESATKRGSMLTGQSFVTELKALGVDNAAVVFGELEAAMTKLPGGINPQQGRFAS